MPFEKWILVLHNGQPVSDFVSQSDADKDENDLFIRKTNICNKFQTNGKLLVGMAVLDKHSINPFYHYWRFVNVITNAMFYVWFTSSKKKKVFFLSSSVKSITSTCTGKCYSENKHQHIAWHSLITCQSVLMQEILDQLPE